MSTSKKNDSDDRTAQIFSSIVVWIFLGTTIMIALCGLSGSDDSFLGQFNPVRSSCNSNRSNSLPYN